MDRTVESILAVWRELERDLEMATDADIREDLQARIVELRNAHREAVAKSVGHDEPHHFPGLDEITSEAPANQTP